jgi:dihydroorotate dehydrogenase (NAD+) catalytic subunit
MINRIGLANPGVAEVVRKKLPYLLQFDVPVIVNVSGSIIEEYVEVVRQLNSSPNVSAYEINISCPNVKQGGLAFGIDPVLATEVISAVRSATNRILIVKLTPNVASVIPVATAAIRAGANALSLVNTFLARAKIWNGPNRGQYVEGGLSGPCIMPIALRQVSDLAKANLGAPIIGIGGIQTICDVVAFLESGAGAVQIGTANFVNPLVMMELVKELGLYIEKTGCQSLKEWREKGFPMPS